MDVVTWSVLGKKISELSDITTVAAVENVYALDLNNRVYSEFSIASSDANAKSITLSNIPSTAGKHVQVLVMFLATTACAITHPTGATFAAGAPTFTTGFGYWILYETLDGGTTWAAFSRRRT